jgi:hypothetical protein
VTEHKGNTSRALKNNVEGPLGLSFTYIKHCPFFQAWRDKKKKRMVYIMKNFNFKDDY